MMKIKGVRSVGGSAGQTPGKQTPSPRLVCGTFSRGMTGMGIDTCGGRGRTQGSGGRCLLWALESGS